MPVNKVIAEPNYIINEAERTYVTKDGRTITEQQMLEAKKARENQIDYELKQLKLRNEQATPFPDIFADFPREPMPPPVLESDLDRIFGRDINGVPIRRGIFNTAGVDTTADPVDDIRRAQVMANRNVNIARSFVPPVKQKEADPMANVDPNNPSASDLPADCVVQVSYPGSNRIYTYNAQGCKVGDYIVVGPTPVSSAPQVLEVLGLGRPADSTYTGPLKRAMRVPTEMLR